MEHEEIARIATLARRPAKRLEAATSVVRRVWPNAPETSHKGLFTRAVWAEQRGDLGEALLYALEAYEVRPSQRNARYLADLERRESWWARATLDGQ